MMLMPMEVARGLAFTLDILASDSMSPAFGFDAEHPAYPPYSRASQQLSVDMIYRCLKCRLIEISSPILGMENPPNIDSFVQELARVNQYGGPGLGEPGYQQYADDMGIWLGPLLSDTSCGRALIRKYIPEDGSVQALNEIALANFNTEVCAIFEANGVGWSDEPLVSAGRYQP